MPDQDLAQPGNSKQEPLRPKWPLVPSPMKADDRTPPSVRSSLRTMLSTDPVPPTGTTRTRTEISTATRISLLEQQVEEMESSADILRQEFESVRETSRRIENNWNTVLDFDRSLDGLDLLGGMDQSTVPTTFSREENVVSVSATQHEEKETLPVDSGLSTSMSSSIPDFLPGQAPSDSKIISVPGASSVLTNPASSASDYEAQISNLGNSESGDSDEAGFFTLDEDMAVAALEAVPLTYTGFATSPSPPKTDGVREESPSTSKQMFSAPGASPNAMTTIGTNQNDTLPEPMDWSENNEPSSDPAPSNINSVPSSVPKTLRKGSRSSTGLQNKAGASDDVAKLSMAHTDSSHAIDTSKAKSGFFCICGKKLVSRSGLLGHVRYFTQEWKFKCAECDVAFYSYPDLRNHKAKAHKIRDNLGSDSFGCTKCGMIFPSKCMMNRHHSRDHNDSYSNLRKG